MVRKLAKSAAVKPSTSVKTNARKAKSEEKLSNGYDNQNETTQSKTEVKKSATKVSKAAERADSSSKTQTNKNKKEMTKRTTELKASKTEDTETDNISEEQETMETDSEKEQVKQKTNTEISDEPKATERTRKRKAPTTVKEIKEKSAVPKTKAKRQKVLLEIPKISSVSGKVFVIGENDVGQLGLGEDVQQKKRPALLELPYSIADIAAGGMHSVCLTESGEVITFGCNDEGALGRITAQEGSEMVPQRIDIPERIVQVSAGDSHSAALSESGQVYIWGNFRNGNGPMGLVTDGAKQLTPVKILNGVVVVKISSGSDHLVCLSQEGIVYTCGCGEAGQLGRFTERAVEHGDRTGRNFISAMLSPDKVPVGKSTKSDLVNNIWTGSYATFVNIQQSGAVYAFGLNNYGQLGLQDDIKLFRPKKATSFNGTQWSQINGGQHHTLSLDDNGKVHSLGRLDYGRLGLGESTGNWEAENVAEPTVIPLLKDTRCIDISSGNCASFAVADNGSVYSWGFGTNFQLGHGNEEDQHTPRLIEGSFFNSWKAFKIAGGGQHTLILANPRESLEESQ